MRIVIDLQGAQSSGSRHRGIGRYSLSLAQAIVRNKGEHEVFIALNGLFADSIEPIRAAFDRLLPQENIRVWYAPPSVGHLNTDNNWRRKTAELLRESFLATMQPDIVYVSSLFEGLVDDAVTSIGQLSSAIPTAVTLYDLIPLINRSPYLDNPAVEAWYENKLDQLRRADLLLAISGSSRQEGLDYLGFPTDQVVNVGTAADPQFKITPMTDSDIASLRQRYGLNRPFVMYTGGIDHRKNIEGLIRAFALLPTSLRQKHQLAIVCSVQPENRRQLMALAQQHGLDESDLVVTGFVPEADLIALYHSCQAFVFPSWHEGFGLPALEAMHCGAPVIAANTSSLPEVVGRDDALFDPFNDQSIADKLAQVLTDEVYRLELIAHGHEQAQRFSWDQSARLAIASFESFLAAKVHSKIISSLSMRRPKLAYVSPLPSERSGIADYSAELLPELARFYDIDVIVVQNEVSSAWINENCGVHSPEWLVENVQSYDRILYHFGNSEFHQHMFELIAQVPGIIVLHDFYLSGVMAFMANLKWNDGVVGTFERNLYLNHGFTALYEFSKQRKVDEIILKYPNNSSVLYDALGVIVHSNQSVRLANRWLGESIGADWKVIPLLRMPAKINSNRKKTLKDLGLPEDAFLVCSFGLIGATKQSIRLLNAFVNSALFKAKNNYLIFVGGGEHGDYGTELSKLIVLHQAEEKIKITGWADNNLFHNYLSVADIGVQLRTNSRGETSAAALDCMNYGMATIVNANGSMAELPQDAVYMLPDEFDDTELSSALEKLWNAPEQRNLLGSAAYKYIQSVHAPRTCSAEYYDAIEAFYDRAQSEHYGAIGAISKLKGGESQDLVMLATAMAKNKKNTGIKQLFIDVSHMLNNGANKSILFKLFECEDLGVRLEPVYWNEVSQQYYYARQFTLQLLGCPATALSDQVIDYFAGDKVLLLEQSIESLRSRGPILSLMRQAGVEVYSQLSENIQYPLDGSRGEFQVVDTVICTAEEQFEDFISWLNVYATERPRPLRIVYKHNFDSQADLYFLLSNLFAGMSDATWSKDDRFKFFGADLRLGSQVGQREGRLIRSDGRAGYLLYGPYLSMSAGEYMLRVFGLARDAGLKNAHVDLAIDQGRRVLGCAEIDVNGEALVQLPFTLERDCSDFEIRIWVEAESDLSIDMLEIAPVPIQKNIADFQQETAGVLSAGLEEKRPTAVGPSKKNRRKGRKTNFAF
jgi:glycosyltransferase involved in cell wall biosynthesis